MNFEVGKSYACALNGSTRSFEVLGHGPGGVMGQPDEYIIRWDDGDEEWAYVADMVRWCNEPLII